MNLTDILNSKKLNSLTKYPSIPTYHKISRGILQEELSIPMKEDLKLIATEKIDGSNTRILILNGDYIIGSREEWIYAKNDRIIMSNMANSIFYLKEYIEALQQEYMFEKDVLYCIYGELHGFHIQKSWRNYTSKEKYGYRIFDVWSMPLIEFESLTNYVDDENEASLWRDGNNQPWWDIDKLNTFVIESLGDEVPLRAIIHLNKIPKDIVGAYEFLNNYKKTRIQLDDTYKETKDSEGIVLRSYDRKYIVKMRFEDYKKTIRKMEINK